MLISYLAISKILNNFFKIFLFLPVSALNGIVHNQVVPKTNVKKFSLRKLKIETVLRVQPKFFAVAFLMLEVA